MSNRTSPQDSKLSISTLVGEVLDLGSKITEPKRRDVYCTGIFKKHADISGSLNKLWAEVINTIENADDADYNEDRPRHAYPNSAEFEVSGE